MLVTNRKIHRCSPEHSPPAHQHRTMAKRNTAQQHSSPIHLLLLDLLNADNCCPRRVTIARRRYRIILQGLCWGTTPNSPARRPLDGTTTATRLKRTAGTRQSLCLFSAPYLPAATTCLSTCGMFLVLAKADGACQDNRSYPCTFLPLYNTLLVVVHTATVLACATAAHMDICSTEPRMFFQADHHHSAFTTHTCHAIRPSRYRISSEAAFI